MEVKGQEEILIILNPNKACSPNDVLSLPNSKSRPLHQDRKWDAGQPETVKTGKRISRYQFNAACDERHKMTFCKCQHLIYKLLPNSRPVSRGAESSANRTLHILWHWRSSVILLKVYSCSIVNWCVFHQWQYSQTLWLRSLKGFSRKGLNYFHPLFCKFLNPQTLTFDW